MTDSRNSTAAEIGLLLDEIVACLDPFAGKLVAADKIMARIEKARTALARFTRSETATTPTEIIAWADGVIAAFGTEHAGRITPTEARIAAAILGAVRE